MDLVDHATLDVGDVIHIRWRGVDRDYRVTNIGPHLLTATHHGSDAFGYVTLPFATWGEGLGDPMEITLVRKAG